MVFDMASLINLLAISGKKRFGISYGYFNLPVIKERWRLGICAYARKMKIGNMWLWYLLYGYFDLPAILGRLGWGKIAMVSDMATSIYWLF